MESRLPPSATLDRTRFTDTYQPLWLPVSRKRNTQNCSFPAVRDCRSESAKSNSDSRAAAALTATMRKLRLVAGHASRNEHGEVSGAHILRSEAPAFRPTSLARCARPCPERVPNSAILTPNNCTGCTQSHATTAIALQMSHL